MHPNMITIQQPMKKLFCFCILLCASLTIYAQLTEIYSSRDAAFAEGVELYQQGQFAASERILQQYLRQRGNLTYHEQASFYALANAFELRHKDAFKRLQNYIKEHSYTPYASEVNFMLGTLQVEKEKYKQALKFYADVKTQELFRLHEADYFFHKGYAYLQQKEVRNAATQFDKLRTLRSKYDLQARYYYAFCQYTLQDYGKALPEFLAIEHTAQYKNIVPYYVIQIYYAQGQYDEVYERAEYLLSTNPQNENNGELHRIMGEIYYQKGRYQKAIEYLLEYQKAFTAQKRTLERNDVYLLGMSYYQIGAWSNAVKYLNMVKKEADAMSESTCYHTGNAYVKLGQYEQAKMAYAAAMRYQITPQVREEAMYNYALAAYQSSTALGESVTAFTDFLHEYPTSKYQTQVYELLCDVFMSSKNYKAALDALDNIAQPTPKMLATKQYLRYQMGTDAFVQGKYDVAISYFTAVIDHEPHTSDYKTEAYFWLGECYYKQGKHALAQANYEQFLVQNNVRKSENYPLINYSLGYTHFAQKQYTAAQNYFQNFVGTLKAEHRTKDLYADALNRIGDCLFNARKFAEAEQTYAKVISLGAAGVDYATFQQGYALGLLKRYNEKITVLDGLVAQHPKSNYADDAIYEIARAQLQQAKETEAIRTYDRLLSTYPNSSLARKAALEKAMLYYNLQNYDKAIECYKIVVKKYPGSEEAYAALDGLETTYIETNRVNEYLDYTKSLGRFNMKIDSQEDSLTYIAAERQYMLENYPSAVAGLSKYISQYCDGGRYCTLARYYFANSHYFLGHKQEAMEAYQALYAVTGNPYMEEACMRVAEIAYDLQDYQTALVYFENLQNIASTTDNLNVARLGVLRCSYFLNNHESTIRIAQLIIEDPASSASVIAEAQYNLGKAHVALTQWNEAIAAFTPIATSVRTANGAEAKYLIAEAYYNLQDLDKAEAEIMSFAGMNTQHQYWLAKSFILLADIYVARGDDFQAKQYLLSLQANYKVQDDIHDIIAQRLAAIAEREQAVEPSNEEQQDNEEDL